jgi:tetratricopeptide (TPR) repeat protein
LLQDLQDSLHAGYALNILGLAARARGQYRRAAALIEESLAQFQDLRVLGMEVLTSRGLVALDEGDYRSATASFAASLALLRTATPMWVVAAGLEGMAALTAEQGQAERAARLFGAAEALRTKLGTPIWPVNGAWYERHVAAARMALPEEMFAAAWEAGRAMGPAQAISYALDEDTDRLLPPASPPHRPDLSAVSGMDRVVGT